MLRKITRPLIGETAIREAAAAEFRDVVSLLRKTLPVHMAQEYVEIEAVYPDHVVLADSGRYWRVDYSIGNDNQVTYADKREVTRSFVEGQPVKIEDGTVFLEATATGKGMKYLVRVIRAGASGNNNYYPDAVLREAVPLFNGARVFVKGDLEHLQGNGKDFRNLIGRLSSPRFVEGKSTDSGEIQATLEVLESAGAVAAKMREACERGMADLFGFSVDVNGEQRKRGQLREATRFTKVHSVDLIIEPGAGGQIIRFTEAQPADIKTDIQEETDMKLRARMIEAIKQAKCPAHAELDLETLGEDELEAAYREAIGTSQKPASAAKSDAAAAGGAAPAPAAAAAGVTRDELDSSVRMVEARAHARAAIAESNLPDAAKDRLRGIFAKRDRFVEADVDTAIADEADYLARFSESGHVAGLGSGSRVESGEDRSEKVGKMLDALFDPKDKACNSIREAYIEITGDRRITGHLQNCDASRMREALGGVNGFREALDASSFANVLGDSIARAMVREYNTPSRYDVFRELADVVPVNDFRTQERTRFGGYGDLPAVAEAGAYNALTSPTDEKATYAISKRGGTEKVTLEMVRNDDMSVVQRIPLKLSRAAIRTLAKFVMDFLNTNPVIYDGDTLFHANHNNLGTTALDATSLAARRLAMLKQTELDSADRLGIPPMHLWVPADLEEAAFDLFRRQTNNETDFIESLQLKVMPVWYWTDVNNWYLTADKRDIPLIELGFLDGNETPELFVQDSPTVGSLFSNDQITWKIRHIYGGNVLDYRGFQGSVVA